MPTHLKALLIILVIATISFMLAKAASGGAGSPSGDFERRRNLWFAVTLTVFLAHNFWVYIIVTSALILIALPRESNKFALYLFLLLAVPPFAQEISGLGIMQHFFSINYHRLLALTILLPAYLSLRKQPETVPFGALLPDKLLAAYLILLFGLTMTVSTLTGTLRSTVFYAFLDILLPYFVASRSLGSSKDFREALLAFVSGALVMAAIGVFETGRHWLLYAAIPGAMGIDPFSEYLLRGNEGLRAQGTTGHAIVLGYTMVVALGFFLFLSTLIPSRLIRFLVFLAFAAGLYSPISRGPWVGAAAMLLIFVATGPSPAKHLMKAAPYAIVAFAALLATSSMEKIISLLPFLGTSELEGSVIYRQRLLEIGIAYLLESPIFGSYDFFLSADALELKQGNGMIDMVNTFLAVGLGSGLVGLSLYCGFFIAVAAGIFKEMRKQPNRTGESYRLGQALVSILVGMLVILGTVSSIYVIPILTWCVAGFGVAFARHQSAARAAPQEQPLPA